MKKLAFSLFICVSVFGSFAQRNAVITDATFNAFKLRFIDALWKNFPAWATENGYHKYDDVLSVPNEENRDLLKRFAQTYLDSLSIYKPSMLDVNNQTDLQLIQNQLQHQLWQLNVKKDYEWNPALYNVTGIIAYIVNEPYDKLEKRLSAINNKLTNVPAYYEAAQSNLIRPVHELRELAIEQNTNGISVLEKDLKDSIKISKLSPQKKQEMNEQIVQAVSAIKGYVEFLKGLANQDGRSFRLGADLYKDEFNYSIQSSLSVDELYKAAQDRKQFLIEEMGKIADELWEKYFPGVKRIADPYARIRKVIDTLSATHVEPKNFRSAIEQQIPKLAAFVKAKNLLYLDPTKPLKVRNEPGYMAGVAGASVSAPGPYDKNGKTYYNVGTLDGWPADKAESYLREYNDYTMQILNIHEAIPGHYAQLVYANKSPDIIKSILGNGSMVEGWAVYSELMMMQNGYGGDTPEMWLMYYKWNLRSVCNTILDISVHTRDMNKEEAMDLLVRQAFQQQAEADGKWRRVNVTSVQLTSYFNGFHEILKLRDAWKKKVGTAYNVKDFNEKFLSYGSIPVKYISALMLSGK